MIEIISPAASLLTSTQIREAVALSLSDALLHRSFRANEEMPADQPGDVVDDLVSQASKLLDEQEQIIAVDDALTAAQKRADEIRVERLRQARTSFNYAIALSGVGVVLVLVGLAMVLASLISVAMVSGAVGCVCEVSSIILFRLNRESNDRLDQLAQDLRVLGHASLGARI